MRSVFVVTQVALALVLLVGAGLLVKSFNRLAGGRYRIQSKQPADDARESCRWTSTTTEQKRIDFFKQAVERMKAIPGVEAVGAINTPPFTGLYPGTNCRC